MRFNSIHISFGILSLFCVMAVSCTGDDGNATGECGAGTELCGSTCTSMAIDPNNCGACGNVCAAGEACDNGTCSLSCSGGSSRCGDSCVDMQNDPNNCGACDTACVAEQEVCLAGKCAATCGAGGFVRCGDSCVDPMSSAENCGACGTACAGTEACISGQCIIQEAPKAVYTMTNDPSGNKILSFTRSATGTLEASGMFADTGGRGSGNGLGNQHGLIYDSAQNLFFVVNAGDNTISMLSLNLDGSLELLSNVNSGGERPISITVNGSRVFVVNAGVMANGTSANISGFQIAGSNLMPINNSTQPLSATNPNPAQIQFSPDGQVLAVTEKGTNMITTYTMTGNTPSAPIVNVSAGQTPFGFDFTASGYLIVSEAVGGQPNLSSTSSYAVEANGMLTPVSPAVVTMRTAACWLVVSGDYAYVANAQTNDITGFQVAGDGMLSMLDANGVTGQATMAPVDEDVTDDNDFLYVLNNGSHSFSIFQINGDGSLTKMPDFMGVPTGASGIVAR